MLIVKKVVETRASPLDVWQIWQDVENWNTWDHGIEFSAIEGPFIVGTKGVLKPKRAPLVHTKLIQVEPLKSFTIESNLFLAKIVVSHELSELDGKIALTHQVEIVGPFSFFFAFFIGRKMKRTLPRDMECLIEMVKKLHNKRKDL